MKIRGLAVNLVPCDCGMLGAPGEDFGEPKAGAPPSQEFFRSKRTGRQNVGLGRAVAAIRFTLARMTASGAIEPFRPDRANAYCCPFCDIRSTLATGASLAPESPDAHVLSGRRSL